MRLGAFILGQREDSTIAAVAAEAVAAGLSVVVFDQFRHQAAIDYAQPACRGRWPFSDWLEGLDGVALYSRVKRPKGEVRAEFQDLTPSAENSVGPYQTKEFFRAEWRVFRRSLVRTFMERPNVRMVNAGEISRDASLKPLQLQVASDLGLKIPRTVIGNSEAALEQTFGDAILYKPLSGALAAGRGVPPPALLPKAAILAERRATVAPSIFQERILKQRELRILVAGDAIRTIEIDSQAHPSTSLDWRVGESNAGLFKWVETPACLEVPLRRYMAHFELDVGVFDFAIDVDGDPIFFECNPAGQFQMMEIFTGVPFTDDLVRVLVEKARAAAPSSLAHRSDTPAEKSGDE